MQIISEPNSLKLLRFSLKTSKLRCLASFEQSRSSTRHLYAALHHASAPQATTPSHSTSGSRSPGCLPPPRLAPDRLLPPRFHAWLQIACGRHPFTSSSHLAPLVYFDRVQFKGMRVNRTYPTIVGWSAELARKRVKEENKAGSFGRGTVLPRISKPTDIAAATSGQNDQPPVAALNIPSSSVDRVAGILQKLASTIGEFGEAMAEIGKQGAPVNVMRKTFSGLSNMLNVASTIEATSTPTSSQLDDIFFGSESFTTAVDALLQLDPTHEWMKCLPMEKKKQNFYERMTYEIERLQNLDINDADLIFFPVLRHGHYFLICINVKASKLEIIDNKSLVRGVTMKDKYGDCTTLLVTALKEYLALGSSALFWKVDELTEEVVDMSWKESENYIDCGLFVMRHMETYKGTLKKWNPGFKKKARLNEDFLIGLRARYAATIIRWRANILKNIVIKKTKLLYNKK
nr:uncharacterized protein LOC109158392 [Ipomoea batatas]